MDRRGLALNLLRDPVHLFALGFGSGLSPWAPGTCGSLLALPLAWALTLYSPLVAAGIVAVFVVAGIWVCGESARRLGVHDHPAIVWDEIAAMCLVALAIPSGLVWLALGFIAFRIFDIFKPWPIRDLDHRLAGGLGIMLDDVVAAVYAAASVRLVEYLTTVI
ncbi:MAG: phosphatidylglycerophosphatase A [Gammaproteobacteria bacterium]|nr:phosphatidylglycerophosphatase A [Gammaproteobacteria bacterium]